MPENHLVHFIIEAIEQLDLRGFKVNTTGSGSEQYPPAMMVILLLYCYATGRMSSRVIEEAKREREARQAAEKGAAEKEGKKGKSGRVRRLR
jgi:transposase